MNKLSYITKVDYLGPHRISTTGETGTNYSIENIEIQKICNGKLIILNASQQRLYVTIASQHRASKPEQMGFCTPTKAVKATATETATDAATVTAAAYRTIASVAHDGKAKPL
jgi:hypothetical protein